MAYPNPAGDSISAHLGPKVTGIDLEEAAHDEDFVWEMKRLLASHLALLFPGQKLTGPRGKCTAAISPSIAGRRRTRRDLPLNFHPAAVRVSGFCTPSGAGWSKGRSAALVGVAQPNCHRRTGGRPARCPTAQHFHGGFGNLIDIKRKGNNAVHVPGEETDYIKVISNASAQIWHSDMTPDRALR